MDSLNKLMEYFGEFPGIGPRQARRFAYFILTKNPSYTEELSRLIIEAKKSVHVCSSCFRFYTSNKNFAAPNNVGNLCSICADPGRNRSELMLVARDVDLESVEKSKTYQGLYFVLGGTVPILEKNPETRIRSRDLLKRLEKDTTPDATGSQPVLKEIILSLNANPEGEHTVDVVRSMIKQITEPNAVKISILGRGMSTGSELEYSDAETIKNALKNRA